MTARRWILAIATLATAACAGGKLPSAAPPTDAQLRPAAPRLTGDWLVTEAGKPRTVWTMTLTGTALTGTIAIDPRDVLLAPGFTAQPIKGTLVGVGTDWQVKMEKPAGYLVPDIFKFEFCPLAGGDGGCRTGQLRFAAPSPGATLTPVSTGAASPSTTATGAVAATGATSP